MTNDQKTKTLIQLFMNYINSDIDYAVLPIDDVFKQDQNGDFAINFDCLSNIFIDRNDDYVVLENDTLTSYTTSSLIECEVQPALEGIMELIAEDEKEKLLSLDTENFIENINLIDFALNIMSNNQLALVSAKLMEQQDYYNSVVYIPNKEKYLATIPGRYDEPTLVDPQVLVDELLDYYNTDKKALLDELENMQDLVINIAKQDF